MPNLSFHQHAVSLRDNSIDANGMNAYIIKDDDMKQFKFIPDSRSGKHKIRTDLDIQSGDIIETNYFGNKTKRFSVIVTKRLIGECFCHIEIEEICLNL